MAEVYSTKIILSKLQMWVFCWKYSIYVECRNKGKMQEFATERRKSGRSTLYNEFNMAINNHISATLVLFWVLTLMLSV